jgi:hypothetical protein
MIKSIQPLPGPAGGYRVGFRLNESAVQCHCWSPVYPTLGELYEAHPDLAPPVADQPLTERQEQIVEELVSTRKGKAKGKTGEAEV